MYKTTIAAAAMLMLSACSTQHTTSNTNAQIHLPFQALGVEPGWSVKIDENQQADVLLNYGDQAFTIALPDPDYSYAGTHYRSTYNQQPLHLDILHKPCTDTMSDTEYPYEAVFQVENQVLRGCGRPL